MSVVSAFMVLPWTLRTCPQGVPRRSAAWKDGEPVDRGAATRRHPRLPDRSRALMISAAPDGRRSPRARSRAAPGRARRARAGRREGRLEAGERLGDREVAERQVGEAIAALERDDEPPAAERSAPESKPAGQGPKPSVVTLIRPSGSERAGIRPAQTKISSGPNAASAGATISSHACEVADVAGARRQRNVDRRPGPCAEPRLGEPPRGRPDRGRPGARRRRARRVVVEDRLRSRCRGARPSRRSRTRPPAPALRVAGRDGDVVEDAEAHRLGRGGVVSGRTHERRTRLPPPAEHRVGDLERDPGREQRRLQVPGPTRASGPTQTSSRPAPARSIASIISGSWTARAPRGSRTATRAAAAAQHPRPLEHGDRPPAARAAPRAAPRSATPPPVVEQHRAVVVGEATLIPA